MAFGRNGVHILSAASPVVLEHSPEIAHVSTLLIPRLSRDAQDPLGSIGRVTKILVQVYPSCFSFSVIYLNGFVNDPRYFYLFIFKQIFKHDICFKSN